MAATVNQAIADQLLRRQIQAGRVEAGLRRQVLEQLAILEQDLLADIRKADPTQFALLSRRRREVEAVLAEDLDPLIQERYQRIAALLDAALVRLAQSEAAATQGIVNGEAEDEVITEQPSDRQLRAGVTHSLFPSASKPTDLSTTGSDWWTRAAASLSQRLGDTLLVSVSLEESLTQLVQRVHGTQAQGFNDGVMARARQDATRLLATQVTNTLGETHALVAARNVEAVVLQHVSIRDLKTSIICISRDGKRFTADTHEPIGHSIPYLTGVPYHPNCRSDIITVLRTGGPVAQETMSQWLRRQGPAVQDELLGPTRAQMWREGKISATDLLSSLSGKVLTLVDVLPRLKSRDSSE